MVDLDVYRLAGRVLLEGGDLYNLPGRLPASSTHRSRPCSPFRWRCCRGCLVQVVWTGAGAVALVAVLHRFGLTGWVLSLVAAATMFVVQPVVQTLGYGQLRHLPRSPWWRWTSRPARGCCRAGCCRRAC